MTELWKAGLSLLFPLYLLTIVIVLIILSHFFLSLSNKIADSSVQVLVTVVNLSYGRLLSAIIYAFTFLKSLLAPYKNGKQYWFVARLLLLIMMYTLYSIEPYAQVIYIAIASIFFFIIGQPMFRPYQSNFINLLDCWLLFNLAFVHISTWYLGHMEVTGYSIVPILLFFLTIFNVYTLHIYLVDICNSFYYFVIFYNVHHLLITIHY